jgi:large subunit ribosomal protein L21
MFAVIKTGGKQYRVAEDQMLEIEKVQGEPGQIIQLGDVLMLGGEQPTFGTPTVSGASVAAEVLSQGRGPKIIAFKKRRRKNSRRKRGHRDPHHRNPHRRRQADQGREAKAGEEAEIRSGNGRRG